MRHRLLAINRSIADDLHGLPSYAVAMAWGKRLDAFELLNRSWSANLAALFASAKAELTISSPFISLGGADFMKANVSPAFRQAGEVEILTDLSPLNICQKSTDPFALKSLADSIVGTAISHLPRLHAKVYIADSDRAIVTSGNLTSGGLNRNYEYGVEVRDPVMVCQIRREIREYAKLGAMIDGDQLTNYCEIAARVLADHDELIRSSRQAARREFEHSVRAATDELVRLRLGGGPVTRVFRDTILYLLRRHGAMTTKQLHPLIQAIPPDLCDDSVDRVIDGQHFGKRWKHLVRIAQSHLKVGNEIVLRHGKWTLVRGADSPL